MEPLHVGPAPFFVLRASGHVGSRWLGELLATQNLTFFFEFAGRCSERRYPLMANASMQQIFGSACACRMDANMESVCASDASGRIRSMGCVKDAFCARRCPQRNAWDSGCAAVGMVDSYQPALARRIAAAQEASPAASRMPSFHRRIGIVTYERDNAAKHALSKLRASCGGTALKGNHLKAPPTGSSHGHQAVVANVSSHMVIDPHLFFAEASQSLLGRRRMREGVARTLGTPTYALHYEDLQRDAGTSLRALLAAIGVVDFDQRALSRSALRKGSSDDLRRTLLNFRELHDSLRDTPCLQRMLGAREPQRFDDSCGLVAPTTVDGVTVPSGPMAHQAKQDTSVRVLRCAPTTCTLAGMNRRAAAAVADAARAAGLRPRRKQRRSNVLPTAQLQQPRHGVNASEVQLPSTMAALVAGECTDEERRMCARALRRGSKAQAEVCVLRAADRPLR